MRELRFVVGKQGVRSSRIWKAWANKQDVYLLQREMGKFSKFSLHASGVCRWAQNNLASQGADRVIKRWIRGPVPPKGSGEARSLMSLVFPTDHLSVPQTTPKKVHWIEPPPSGSAVAVEFALTAEDESTVQQQIIQGNVRKLLNFEKLSSDINWLVTTTEFACGDVKITVPAAPSIPGVVFGHLEFPAQDTTNTGRPVRMIISQPLTDHNPTFWELGGFKVE